MQRRRAKDHLGLINFWSKHECPFRRGRFCLCEYGREYGVNEVVLNLLKMVIELKVNVLSYDFLRKSLQVANQVIYLIIK